MTVTVLMDYSTIMEEVFGAAIRDDPFSRGSEVPQTHSDIVRGMRPTYANDEWQQRERQRLIEAHQKIIEADRVRVMNFTGLRSPFGDRSLA